MPNEAWSATVTTTFTIEPQTGVLPVRFGMTAAEVARVLGPPVRTTRNYLSEREEQRSGVNVRYAERGEVVEVSLLPSVCLLFHGTDLFKEVDPIGVLRHADPNPYEWVGFAVFLSLGVAVSGYHDNDSSQRAITVSKLGRWDTYKAQFVPMP
jgi:hypothetical protein